AIYFSSRRRHPRVVSDWSSDVCSSDLTRRQSLLTVLVVRKLWRLVRDYRAHVPGSRLTARTVGIFGALVIAPLLIVYLSSLEFINQGIDSWFKVEVRRGLSDAVVLSRAALDLRTREYTARTLELASALTRASPA